jgi:DNA-binding NarL/FixJ family response regulator
MLATAAPLDEAPPPSRPARRARLHSVSRPAEVHLFICSQGVMLPRWSEAFPFAYAVRPEDGPSTLEQSVRLVWLRLDEGRPVADQLAAVPEPVRHLPLIVMSDVPADEESLAAFGAGARGYCNTHAAAAVLQQVAAVVLQGGLWIGQSLMQRLLRATASIPVAQPVPAATAWDAGLTDREREVAASVAAGASNKEVARALGISERTVKAHVGAVLEKVGVRDRLQLSLVVHGRAARPKA